MISYPFTSRVTYDAQSLPIYDRAVDSAFLRRFYKAYWDDGVFYKPSTSFAVTATGTGMNVQVQPGMAQVQGAFCLEDTVQTLPIAAADASLNRIDSVVLRLDLSLDKRDISLAVVRGVAAVSPVAPALTRNNTTWELGIANVLVSAGAGVITQRDVEDTRLDDTRCGAVAQTVGELDTSGFFAQLTAMIARLREEIGEVETGTAAMLRSVYDPDSKVSDAGGIKAYTKAQTDVLAADITKVNSRIAEVNNTLANLQYSNPGAHNAIYRGKYLGDFVTDAQYAAIKAGTFDNLFIGDYWTIDGVNWRIAAFDYFYNCGDTNFTKHHVVVVPDTSLYEAQMNTGNTTTGGYAGSAMYKSNLAQAKTTIKAAFGSAHVLTKRELLTTAANGNTPSGWAWFDSDVELMNEVQAYGSVACAAHDGNGFNVASGNGQFPLFMFDRTKLHNRENYWLRDVAVATSFSAVSYEGSASSAGASDSHGVRPFFCIG